MIGELPLPEDEGLVGDIAKPHERKLLSSVNSDYSISDSRYAKDEDKGSLASAGSNLRIAAVK